MNLLKNSPEEGGRSALGRRSLPLEARLTQQLMLLKLARERNSLIWPNDGDASRLGVDAEVLVRLAFA